jgi:hypothetical protein
MPWEVDGGLGGSQVASWVAGGRGRSWVTLWSPWCPWGVAGSLRGRRCLTGHRWSQRVAVGLEGWWVAYGCCMWYGGGGGGLWRLLMV